MSRFRTVNRPQAKKTPLSLLVEPLEPRLLLATISEGIEPDGDVYQIKLTGPGMISDADLNNLTLIDTTLASKLTVSVTTQVGDGTVAVGSLTTGGANLGRINIDGDLSALSVGQLGRLDATTLGLTAGATGQFDIVGHANRINIPGGINEADITVNGNLDMCTVGSAGNTASHINNATIHVTGSTGRFTLKQSLTAGSAVTLDGTVDLFTIDKSVVNSQIDIAGDVKRMTISGGISSGSSLDIAGDLTSFKVSKTVRDTVFNVGGTIKKVCFNNDIVDSTLTANAIDQMLVGDDLNNTRIGVTADIKKLRANDTRNLTLRVGGSLERFQVRRDVDQALISVLNDIDTIKFGGDMNCATIMAGIDIGVDLIRGTADDAEWGDVNITAILIRGDMIDSSIAAGVNANDAYYGNGDDFSTSSHIGTARINRILVNGEITSTSMPGESFALTADDGIDLIRSLGQPFTGIPGVVVQEW